MSHRYKQTHTHTQLLCKHPYLGVWVLRDLSPAETSVVIPGTKVWATRGLSVRLPEVVCFWMFVHLHLCEQLPVKHFECSFPYVDRSSTKLAWLSLLFVTHLATSDLCSARPLEQMVDHLCFALINVRCLFWLSLVLTHLNVYDQCVSWASSSSPLVY